MKSTRRCADCDIAIGRQSIWCGTCWRSHRGEAKHLKCIGCGRPSKAMHQRCSVCAPRGRLPDPTCQMCGGRTSSRRVQRCQACIGRLAAPKRVCPDCGNWKTAENQTCAPCWQRRRTSGQMNWQKFVKAFDPAAFQAELNRSDLEWSVGQLATAAGVHPSTIYNWLHGRFKPSRVELDQVMAVLCFERCKNCCGLGYTDPAKRAKSTGKIAS